MTAHEIIVGHSILAVGSIALDYLEMPDGKRGEVIGGSLTYFTLAASRFASVHVVGVVGTDFPDEGMKIFRKYGANLEDLRITEGKTFRWGGRYHDNWEDRTTLYTELGVFSSFQPLVCNGNRMCPYVYLGNIHPALQLQVLEQVDDPEQVVCDTMNLWIETTRRELLKVLENVDVLLINESEARLLAQDADTLRSARQILKMGPSAVVIKWGSQGAWFVSSGNEFRVSAFKLNRVVDPTGAGDSFAGGFVGSLAIGKTVEDALVAGSAVASFCVEGFGIEKLLDYSQLELKRRIQTIRKNSSILQAI